MKPLARRLAVTITLLLGFAFWMLCVWMAWRWRVGMFWIWHKFGFGGF